MLVSPSRTKLNQPGSLSKIFKASPPGIPTDSTTRLKSFISAKLSILAKKIAIKISSYLKTSFCSTLPVTSSTNTSTNSINPNSLVNLFMSSNLSMLVKTSSRNSSFSLNLEATNEISAARSKFSSKIDQYLSGYSALSLASP